MLSQYAMFIICSDDGNCMLFLNVVSFLRVEFVFVTYAMYLEMFVVLHTSIYQHFYSLILYLNFSQDLTLLSLVYVRPNWTSAGA
jgi:hypothetical protein